MSARILDTTKREAIEAATLAADLFGIAQTVYHNAHSGGWWHTWFGASLLARSDTRMHVTILPVRLFQ